MDPSHEQGQGSGARHEERDANIRAVLWFAAGLAATVVVVLVLMKWAFNFFPTLQRAGAPSQYAQPVANEPPPEPRLQIDAPEDLKKMREQEDSVLTSYGWVNKQEGIVRIPVERAMDLLVQRSARQRQEAHSRPPGE